MTDRTHSAASLLLFFLLRPRIWRYAIYLCADSAIPPSPWASRFRIEVSHHYRIVRLAGEFT